MTVKRYRQAQAIGIEVELESLAMPGCCVSEAQSGRTYSLDGLPPLPHYGCTSSHGCGCCYSPVT
jgi:hypothetical protein